MSNEDRFADAPISRRRFFQLSGATGAALALPGNASAAPVAPDSWKNRRREIGASSNLSSLLMGDRKSVV